MNQESDMHGHVDTWQLRLQGSLTTTIFGVLLLVLSSCTSTASTAATSVPQEPPPTHSPAIGATEATTPTAAVTPASSPTPTTPAAEPSPIEQPSATPEPAVIRTGAGSLVDQDLAPLHGQRVGLIAHRASVVDGTSLASHIDKHPMVELAALFAPEHGLYGSADAGASVADVVDPATGAPVYSLYGANRSPSPAALADLDVLVYDLQDVGVRFYTYTSTLGLAMQAAATAGVEFIVLDRPNPIGADQLQGPTLTSGLESFIGMYNMPSAYGLTAGELAMLIQRNAWLPGLEDLQLAVVPIQNWTRTMRWSDTGLPWIPPSPNLPTPDAALVYPGTVLFEATTISEGRGTDEPFTLIGAAWIDGERLAATLNDRELAGVRFEPAVFTPRSIPGAAESPRFLGQELTGVRIAVTDPHQVEGVQVGLVVLDAVLRQAENVGRDATSIIDRPNVFDRLAGGASVRGDLLAGRGVEDIVAGFDLDQQTFAELAADIQIYD